MTEAGNGNEHQEPLDPADLQETLPRRGRRGYDSDAVDDLIAKVTISYELVRRERRDLREEVERQRSELARLQDEQPLVQDALISAHRAARELMAEAEQQCERLKSDAHRDAGQIVEKAQAREQEMMQAVQEEHSRLEEEIGRLRALAAELRQGYRAFLLTALELLEDSEEASGRGETVAELAGAGTPIREDETAGLSRGNGPVESRAIEPS